MRNRQTVRLTPAAARRDRADLLRTTALQAAFLLIFIVSANLRPAFAQPAVAQPAPGAHPAGGVVVAGGASISQTAASTTVAQSTQRAAIDWRSFDIGAGHTVQFQQPGASAIVLNRVTGPDPSQIAGRIQANGQVIITNQSGVVFHRGAQVEAAGLIASAAGIATPNFMAGRMVFDQAPKPDAAVTNAGSITVRDTGLAALVAPRVANSGVINARMGRVVLAGAETHTVDLYGDGLLSIDVTSQVRRAPRDPDGKPVTALVTNTGVILADGGSVTLTAAAADGIVQNLVQAGGTLQANAAGGRTGTIVIAGVGGSVRIEGRAGAAGGVVLATATDAVNVAAPARISASGPSGGTIAIGTRAARSVTVEAGARIAADAHRTGNGGRITVVSSGTTIMDGVVTARGGRSSGNGGAVELSGKTLGLTGRVDTAAPGGHRGQVLIDPTDVSISDHGGPGTVVTPATLEAIEGDVTVAADNSVVASSSVTLGGALQRLTLTAGNLVRIDPGVTLSAGGIALNAGAGGVTILGNLTTMSNQLALSLNATGPVTQGAASTITTNEINGTVGSAALTSRLNQIVGVGSPISDGLQATAGDISVVTSLPLTVHGASAAFGTVVPDGHAISFTTDALTLVAGQADSAAGGRAAYAPNGTINIQAFTANLPVEVTTNGPSPKTLSIASGSLGLLATPNLSLGSATGGPINLAPDGVAIDFGVTGITTLTLRSAGNIGQAGAIGVTNINAAGLNVDLSAANNFIPNIAQLAAANNALLHTGGTLNVNGPVAGPNTVALSSTGRTSPSMTLNANITGGVVNLDTNNGVSLASSGGIAQNGGVIDAAVLDGNAGSALFGQPNNVGVRNFHTAGNFTFNAATPILLNGALQSDLGVVRLTTPGAITQGANSVLTTPTLTGIAGSAAFLGAANRVGSLQNFTTTAGGLALATTIAVIPPGPSVTGGSTPLLLAGVTTAPTGQTISIIADRVAFSAGPSPPGGTGTLAAPAGVVSFAPLGAGRPVELVATANEQSPNALSLTQANVNAITTGTLRLGSPTAGPILLGQAADALVLAGHAATLNLATAGGVTQGEGATLAAGALTGAAASLSLPGANQVGTLGAFTTGGALTLNDATALNVTGPVTAGGVATLGTAGGLALGGSLAAPAIQLTAGPAGISQTAGVIATPGTLKLNTAGGAAQSGTGSITANSLTGAVGGTVALNGGGNSVSSLGPFTSAGGFSLVDTSPLAITGAVRTADVAPSLSLASPGFTFGPGGSLVALDGTVILAPNIPGNALALSSLAAGAASVVLTGTLQLGNAATGPITIDGPFNLSNTGTLRLASAGAISETPTGALTINTLSAGGASLALGGANRITTLGAVSETGDLLVTNAQGLSASGPIVSGTRVQLDAAGDLALLGSVRAPLVTLNATGAITQPGGFVSAKQLSVTTGADATLMGDVASLGAVQVPGTFNFQDTAPALVIGGPVNAGTFNLGAGALDVAGALRAGTLQLDVASGGQSGGALQAGVLRGRSAGTLQFGSANGTASVAAIENLAAASLTVNDSVPLLVRGTLRVPQLALRANSLTLQGGVINADFAAFEAAAPGKLSQTGTTTIAPVDRPAAQVSMTVHGGLIALENLVGPSINLTLAMSSGRATGTLNAAALNVADQGGGASLQGTVAGRSGFDAASIATITVVDPAYTLNGCTIAAVNCVPRIVPPTVRLVFPSTIRPDVILVESLLRADLFTADLVTLDLARSPSDPDFALPNISDRDY